MLDWRRPIGAGDGRDFDKVIVREEADGYAVMLRLDGGYTARQGAEEVAPEWQERLDLVLERTATMELPRSGCRARSGRSPMSWPIRRAAGGAQVDG